MEEHGFRWDVANYQYAMLKIMREGVHQFPPSMRTFDLRHLLYVTKRSHLTDPRDRIFAVLAVAHPEARAAIRPDYHKSVEDVFREAVIYMLEVEKSLDMYAFAPLERQSRTTTPSWVPNFDIIQGDSLHGRPGNQMIDEDTFVPHRGEDVRISDCGKKLVMRCLFLDQIRTIVATPDRGSPVQGFCFDVATDSVDSINCGLALSSIKQQFNNCVERLGSACSAEPLWKLLMLSGTGRAEWKFQPGADWSEKCEKMLATAGELSNARGTGAYWRQRRKFNSFVRSVNAAVPLSLYILRFCLWRRRFFAGASGWYGIAEGDVMEGDYLALIFPDTNLPFVIRRKVDCFEMVGLACIPQDMRSRVAVARSAEFQTITIQ